MKKIIIASMLALGALTSCNQGLLDIEQLGVSSMDTYYANATDEQARSLIAVLYRTTSQYHGAEYLGYMSELADECVSWPRLEFINLHANSVTLNSENHPMNKWYQWYFQANYRCNLIIERMSDNTPEKKRVIGEAYFFRAWSYLNLIRGWGNPPLVDHVLTPDELEPANASTEELWKYVTTSLEKAIEILPAKKSLGGQFNEIGARVSKQAAQSLLGKAYLLMGDMDKAASTLKNVINSGLYKIQDDFATLYRPAADFCDEYMWEWNVCDENTANYQIEGTSDKRMLMSWASEMTMPGTLWRQGKSQWGYSHGATREMVDFMYDRGEYGKERWMCSIWDYSQLLQKWTELEGDSMEVADKTSGLMWLQKGSPVAGHYGFFRSKFYWYKDDIFPSTSAWTQYSKANWPAMRYAEVLLMYAEAVAGKDSDGLGLKGLNAIRNRAGLESLSSYTLQDVKDEKRAELFCEGERYYDLIRWGDAASTLKNQYTQQGSFYGYKEGTDPTITGKEAWDKYDVIYTEVVGRQDFIAGKNEHFPYPYTEMTQNGNLEQNKGW